VAQGGTEIAGADDDDTAFAVKAEDLDHVLAKLSDVVADAANAELTEVGEVLTNLGRVEVEAIGQRLAGDRVDALLDQAVHTSEVDREPGYGQV